MRDKISVLYYPGFGPHVDTLKKAALLFDELHIMDRPTFSFAGMCGQDGAPSPLRSADAQFREQGFMVYVHSAPRQVNTEELYRQIQADVDDPEFIRKFQVGLKTSRRFREKHISSLGYGEWGDALVRRISELNLSEELKTYGTATALFEDPQISFYHPRAIVSPFSFAKSLIMYTVMCSVAINFGLNESAKRGFVPLADMRPYGDLLGAKYARAINKLEPEKNNIQLTDLMFAIFDQLVPTELLNKLDIRDVIRYRKASEKYREAFLEHVAVLHAKQDPFGTDGN